MEPSAQSAQSGDSVLCSICTRQFSKYTCPKCSVKYCSSSCYKNHSDVCTEVFYKNNLMEEMKLNKDASTEEKRRMLEVLKRFEQEFSPEGGSGEVAELEEDESALDDLILTITNNIGEIDITKLPAHQQEEFRRLLADGSLSKLVDLWTPWWTLSVEDLEDRVEGGAEKKSLVQEIGGDGEGEGEGEGSDDDEAPKAPFPRLIEDIKKVEALTKAAPSPLLYYILVDIIYAYIGTMRLYNGDWSADALEAAVETLGHSHVMSKRQEQFASTKDVMTYIIEAQARTGGQAVARAVLDTFKDVALIYGNHLSILLCLGDLHHMFEAAIALADKDKSASNKSERKSLKEIARKIYFFYSWVESWKDGTGAAVVYAEIEMFVEAREKIIAELELAQESAKPSDSSMVDPANILRDQAAKAAKPKKPLVQEL